MPIDTRVKRAIKKQGNKPDKVQGQLQRYRVLKQKLNDAGVIIESKPKSPLVQRIGQAKIK